MPQTEFAMALEELERLIQELESSPDEAAREAMLEALLPFLEFHREAFQRLINLLKQRGQQQLIAAMLEDPLLATALHGYGVISEDAPPAPAASRLIPVEELVAKASAQHKTWVPLLHRAELRDNELMKVQLFEDEVLVWFAKQRGFVFKNRCPQQGHTLEGAVVNGLTLTCPCHGHGFDLRTGRCAERPELRLEMLSVSVDNDLVKVAL